MATMLPNTPRTFTPASLEDIMFEALKALPDDYYVFHSFKITSTADNTLDESEMDFLIFHRKYGILCLEAKAGRIRYENGKWLYASGREIKHNGPYNQAANFKYDLINYILRNKYSHLLRRCKIFHGVWFPSIDQNYLRSQILPPEADANITMTKEALTDPETQLINIFNLELTSGSKTNLSEKDCDDMIKKVLCPQFNIVPSLSFDTDIKKIVFHRLLLEQTNVLNYISEQKTAIINGAAGTGKTLIALEKAKRHAINGDKVLFLCYNKKLKDYLSASTDDRNIEFYTIAGFACKLCNTSTPNYSMLQNILEDMYFEHTFPYKHIIIDEGQDFGMNSIEESNIISTIQEIVNADETDEMTFYVFYDKLQLIQADKMPAFIQDADCKLTLYRNCRNTENIATTSLRPFSERKPKLMHSSIKGVPAKLHFCSSGNECEQSVDASIAQLENDGFSDIVILTCKTNENSVLSGFISDDKYKNKYEFSTCRKFKGLEADAIILVDVDGDTFNSNNIMIYYVGTSRAKLKLDVITTLSEEACKDILVNRLEYKKQIRNPKRELAAALNAVGSIG